MYDRLFKDNKLVAFYSFSIVLVVLLAVVATSFKPSDNSGVVLSEQTTQNTLAQAPSRTVPPPSTTRTSLNCRDCRMAGYSSLCFNSEAKVSYCSRSTGNVGGAASINSCVSCSARATPTPAVRTPTRTITRPCTQVLRCPAAPTGCRYEGADYCTTCGRLVCPRSVTLMPDRNTTPFR